MRVKNIFQASGGFLRRNNYLYWQLLMLFSLTLVVGLLFSLHFILKNTLYWDNYVLFSLFKENLHSLNYFGEIQWWSSEVQSGFPIYYYILGYNLTTPLFAATAFIVWLLGQVGIYIHKFLFLRIVYIGFLVPLIFSLSVFTLARQIFEDKRVIFFLIIAAAISPGVICNLSDQGLEQTAYGIFFAAAFLRFVRKPEKSNFLLMSLCLLILAVSFNHQFLYWNIIFVPMFVLLCFFFGKETFTEKFNRIKKNVPFKHLLALSAVFVICISPLFITFTHGENIVRSTIGERVYDYERLTPGNPLEVLSASTPGIGFMWKDGFYMPMNYTYSAVIHTNHRSYVYGGMLILPLTVIGLIGGTDPWRFRILIMLLLSATVFILSGYSPAFSMILMLPTPLRAVGHYGDSLFRDGVFFLLMLGAGLGFETLLKRPDIWVRRLIWIFLFSFLFSFSIFLSVYRQSALQAHITGFILVIAAFYFIVFFLLKASSSHGIPRRVLVLFLTLFLIDISTFAFWHTREIMWKYDKPIYEPSITEIGTIHYVDSTGTAGSLLELKQIRKLRDAGVDRIPFLTYYNNAESSTFEEFKQRVSAGSAYNTLIIPSIYRNKTEFSPFFEEQPEFFRTHVFQSDFKQLNYNSFRIVSNVPRESILFLRDSYFPGWKATVNGKETEIAEAFWAFKAVVIPEGKSEVIFKFSPGILPYALLLSYVCLLSVFVLWAIVFIKQKRSGLPQVS